MQTAQSLSIPFPEFATFATLPQEGLPQEPLQTPILEENLLNICKSNEKSLPLRPEKEKFITMTIPSFKSLLLKIGFKEFASNIFTKQYPHFDFTELKVDFNTQKIIYPDVLKVWDATSSGNFEHPENFVVLECVTRLMDKGYRPEHIQLEKRWQLGHNASGGKADICVSNETGDQMLLIIECKTAGQEYNKALKDTKQDGGQLFSYLQQERSTQWLVLYCSDWKDDNVEYQNTIIKCSDDANILKMAEKDKSQPTYKNAHTVEELVEVWKETYLQATYDNLIFGEDTQAYKIGIRPLQKRDLRDFTPDDKIVNRFEEILRHNNVSDKENAFNRLIALFICKLVDEIKKNDYDEVEFQYKVGTDTYESLQDRLQRLHKIGMEEFMQEEINYVDDEYADRVFAQLSQSKRQSAIDDLRNTIRILKYYTNNDFTFKDVHNEELFYQNGKILVEVVQLFEKYRIVYSAKHQFLGDLFEQLLNKGFKQNEGQFFTPMPITRFIWDSLPLDKILHTNEGYKLPKVIDYACGAGHFLTEAVEAINTYFRHKDCAEQIEENLWVEKCIYGIEKDYRLARVAKVSLHMNGAGKGQIIFGDGLEQYPEKGITNGTFDILVANPPYSVDAFKAHLKLKNNEFELFQVISNSSSEIETLFVERIAQLLKPKGVAAVLLPITILSNDGSYEGAREQILKHFYVRAIVELGKRTFGATNTGTAILFLEKYNEPPKRKEQVADSVEAILTNEVSEEWEDKAILDNYLQKIGVAENDYTAFVNKSLSLEQLQTIPYFAEYVSKFNTSTKLTQLKSQKSFKSLSVLEQKKKILDLFYIQQLEAENEKIYYFALVYQQNTIIVKAPDENDEQKRFLGYDWSTRRGKEGIQINTPGGMLYDDYNRSADYTLAAAVRYSYQGIQASIPEREQYYIWARLQDMIDFSRPTFNKAIKTTTEKRKIIESKYSLVPIGRYLNVNGGYAFKSDNLKDLAEENCYPVIKIGNVGNAGELIMDKIQYHKIDNSLSQYIINIGDILISLTGGKSGSGAVGKVVVSDRTNIYLNQRVGIIKAQSIKEELNKSYLECILKSNMFREYCVGKAHGSGQVNMSTTEVEEFQIPLPPMKIQQQIVAECQKVDGEYNSSRMTIDEYRRKIMQVFENLQVITGGGKLKLSNQNIFDISIGKRVLNSEVSSEYTTPVYSANVFEPFGMINKQLLTDFSKDSILWGIDGDWMVNVIPANTPFYPTDHCGILRIKTDDVLPKYMAYLLQKEGERAGFKRSYRASIDRISSLTIDVAPIEAQRQAIALVEQYETEIKKAKAVMAQTANKKNEILNRYLN